VYRSVDETAIVHSSPRIILDDGHGRQGHFARAAFSLPAEVTWRLAAGYGKIINGERANDRY
jgi:hypothetical protein